MSILHYKFDEELSPEEQSRVKEIIENAFRTGEIVSCRCAAIEAWVFPTVKPARHTTGGRPADVWWTHFQASFSCTCDAMRPLFSSIPDTE